jgi:hypothetical protein
VKPVTILKRAKKLIETKGWCRGIEARDANGKGVDFNSTRAATYCVLGAIAKAGGTNLGDIPGDVYTALANNIPGRFQMISEFNDSSTTTKKKVLAAFDRAIASLQQPAKGKQ